MKQREFVNFLTRLEKLKCNTRHCYTTSGRRESVAEHSWRLAVMAMLCADEYPDVNIDRVIKMCLIHDIGEAVTGDIPSFYKTDENEAAEVDAIDALISDLPDGLRNEFSELFREMNELETYESKLYKALDNMEAVLAHNESDLSTWIPLEYTENLVYGQENCEFSGWTRELRAMLKADSIEKIKKEGK